MSGSDYGLSLTAWDVASVRPTPEQAQRARVAVASFAHDADDCRDLLAVLGLMAEEE